MNEHLQNILNIIRQATQLSEEEKAALIKEAQSADKAFSITAFKLERTEKVKHTTAVLLEETIEELEQKRKAVEAQNRELEIEAALERVRTIAMSMNKPDDLLSICENMFHELKKLGFKELRNTMINIHYDEKEYLLNYDYAENTGKTVTKFIYNSHPIVNNIIHHARQSNDGFTEKIYAGKELEELRDFRKQNGEADDERLDNIKGLCYYFYTIETGAIGISAYKAASQEELSLLKRFRNVFDLAYKRYTDISNVEAQAREAQIQLALERVRARTMAMHDSEDVTSTTETMFDELKKLGIDNLRCGIANIFPNRTFDVFGVTNLSRGNTMSGFGLFGIDEHPIWQRWFESWQNKEEVFIAYLAGQEKEEYFNNINKHRNYLPQQIIDFPDSFFQAYYFEQGYVWAYSLCEHDESEKEIMKRFATGFSLTFRRYQDLKKAEAQAKESQIQLALERVRARTMAMQKSNELQEAALILFQQVNSLGVKLWSCGFNIYDEDQNTATSWMGSEFVNGIDSSFKTPNDEYIFKDIYEAFQKKDPLYIYEIKDEKMEAHYKYMYSLPVAGDRLRAFMKSGGVLPSTQILHAAFFSGGYLLFITQEAVPEMWDIFKRFANVFEQTYTRFLDLQKAEDQAREAQIEVALERVRARAMAMQRSDELKELIGTVFIELTKLDLVLTRCLIMIYDTITNGSTWWMANSEAPSDPIGLFVKYHEHLPYLAYIKAWKERNLKWQYALEGTNKKEWDDFLFVETELSLLPDFVIAGMKAPDRVYLNASFNSFGNLTLASLEPLSDEHFDILLRFAKVFDLTYTRFNDLKQAEAQARESQIQLALERVRARTMAMQKSDELGDAATIMFHQLEELGVILWATSFDIWKPGDAFAIEYAAGPDGKFFKPFKNPIDYNNPFVNYAMQEWKAGKELIVFSNSGEELMEANRKFAIQPETREIFEYIVAAGYKFPESQVHHFAVFSHGYLQFITTEPYPQAHDIFVRMSKVFEQTYTRFLDLQKAEAQAREAQIEASLERVRSKTMAMHNSNDVGDTVTTMFAEFVHLGIRTNRCGILIFDDNDSGEVWTAQTVAEGKATLIIGKLDLKIYDLLRSAYKSWEDKNSIYQYELHGDDIVRHYEAISRSEHYPIKFDMNALPQKEFHSDFFFPEGAVFAFTAEPIAEEHAKIMKRFAGVFGQTYRRYLDLQKAEAQAREAQIEAALEKVRAKVMSMKISNDLNETSLVFGDQLRKLGIDWQFSYFWLIEEGKDDNVFWITWPDDKVSTTTYSAAEADENFRECLIAWQQQTKIHSTHVPIEDVPAWLDTFERITNDAGGMAIEIMKQENFREGVYYYDAMIRYGSFGILTNRNINQEEQNIQIRFATEFERAYTRFLDLQKAEAQAREGQIQLALERVRARTMAMHKSEELSETSYLLFQQLKDLGEDSEQTTIGIFEEDQSAIMIYSTTHGSQWSNPARIHFSKHSVYQQMYSGWKNKLKSLVIDVAGKELEALNKSKVENPDYQVSADDLPRDRWIIYNAFFSKGVLAFCTTAPRSNESIQLFERFALVFDHTYRRFLDLQKAEAQAREAQIEAALERVRAKAMAMQKTYELMEVAQLLRKEMGLLGVEELETSSIYIHDEATGKTECWYAIMKEHEEERKLVSDHMMIDLNDTWVGRQMLKFYHSGKKQISIQMKGVERKEWINYCADHSKVLVGFYGDDIPDRTYHLYKFSGGYMGAASPGDISTESWNLLQRATSVFSLAYTRFNDLQLAEASAKEAVKQAALDRIRADIASMRTVSDLDRITPLIWNELTILGVSFIRCGVFIMDEAAQLIHTFLSAPDGKAIAAFHLPYSMPGNFAVMLNHWLDKKMYVGHWTAADFNDIAETLVSQGSITTKEQYLGSLPKEGFWLHFLPFLQGMLYVGNIDKLNKEQTELIQHIADAFSTAYARYEDFNKLEAAKKQVDKTLSDLKQAQQQLVQSEKMASLGELTAGIAHEIQNPLNFVNNFSEVNKEMIAELKEEIDKGNYDEVKIIADDIEANEEKINHHGKRADAIVKGMLQHSRKSEGIKEATDINTLCDEYLRLAYHGLRAKDKNFNADFKTDFDNLNGKINIIPQDIGRVLLNLFNNAFYATNEKLKAENLKLNSIYKPIVSIQTKCIQSSSGNGFVEITVTDNGNGIPKNIVDKIFQPFFTTKPTGQGTGLGLSLSYDIIKAHGGEIKVETKEGEGTEFIILLPT